MKLVWVILMTFVYTIFLTIPGNNCCYEEDWQISLSRPGWTNCSVERYLNGLWRENNANLSGLDGIDNIKRGRCCMPPEKYKNDTQFCLNVDWKASLSRDNQWASCPEGFFLRGILRSNGTSLNNIEQASCCRPRNFQNTNIDCYIEGAKESLDKRGWSKCWSDSYYMVGLYRGGCDKLNCVEMFKCCKMMPPGPHGETRSADMVILGHWLLNGADELVRFQSSPHFIEGQCPGSKAVIFNQRNYFANTPIINLNGRSFTIACWIRQTHWVPDKLAVIYGDFWYDPWQFVLSTKNQKIIFLRNQHDSDDKLWSVVSSRMTLDKWTHVAVTWDEVTGSVFIYAEGKQVGASSFTPGSRFFQPTGRRYHVGNDDHYDDYQFHGAVMDLYVFGTALSLEQINRLRGIPFLKNKTKQVTGPIVAVAWEPPLDDACPVVGYTVYYREVMSIERKGKWQTVTVDRNTTSYALHADCWKVYDVAITSRSEYNESILSDSKIWNFYKGIPFLKNKTKQVTGPLVAVAWEPPLDDACPVVGYTVYYREVMSIERKGKWRSVTVDGNTTSYALHVHCRKEYDVAVTSRSEYNESTLIDIWNFKTEGGDSDCNQVDWTMTLSQPGWSNCFCSGSYLTGVWRKENAVEDGINNIKQGRCCIPPQEYADDTPVCQTVDWKTPLSRNNQWASCPKGYFLQGVYRSTDIWLYNIEQALCCKPINFEALDTNLECYDKDVRLSLDKEGWSECGQDWYYMVGVYRGGCERLHCLETIRCCRMKPPDMVVLGRWLLNGGDEPLRFDTPPHFIEGRCPGSKAVIFNQTNSFASTPIIDLNGRSFTIACWIKQTSPVRDELEAIYGDWLDPWQFLLSTEKQKIIFHRHKNDKNEEWWSAHSTKVILDKWTHVAVTWDHVTGSVFIFADGKEIGYSSYTSGDTFFQPTGWLYRVGNDGTNHQFRGSVTDLYVFGTALSVEEIKRLRGIPIIKNTTKAVPGGTVNVAWKPPLEGTCPVDKYIVYYREVMASSKWQSVTASGNATSCTIHLKCRTEYDVAITSLSGHGESSFNESKIWNFKTGGGVPSTPIVINKETEILGCNVNVSWSPPQDNGCRLIMYSIYYRQLQETDAHWFQVNVTTITNTSLTIPLACDMRYTIEISAWNEVGEGGRSRPWIITTTSGSRDTNFKSSESSSGNMLSVSQLVGLTVGLGVLMVIVLMLILSLRRRARKKNLLARNMRKRRSKSSIIPLRRWEVLPEQVVYEKEIGCGAFGKVFKGTLKESPGIEVFYEPRTQTVNFKEGRTVAIKVLGDMTDGEARNQFLEEIELMKEIGSHKNVLNMLGCWVNSDPIFLVLEYVPYGDLLQWLRNKRIQKSYQGTYDNGGNQLTLGTNEVQICIDDVSKPLLTRNDEEGTKLADSEKSEGDSTCSSTLNGEAVARGNNSVEGGPELEGKLNHYEQAPTSSTQSVSNRNTHKEEDFSAKDLLSFAWQIAGGMNFLSNKGFVHRDLAARNVLLGENKVVKICDFGLMRQTHDNVYQLKRGKKIPVKWIAPEALYNSEYTTKSDVWSFGILLWELSTMGGNPYPGINNKELYNLLKTGYRMEKPDTCSDKLYQLMLNCWTEDPNERPSFEIVTRLLEEMMVEDTPYLDLETLDESKSYYCSEQLSDDDDDVVV